MPTKTIDVFTSFARHFQKGLRPQMDAIQQFITEAEATLMAVSGSLAVIGFLGVGAMYLLSAIPVVSEWKMGNPKAFSNVVIGLAVMMFAGGGGVALLLGS